MLRWVANLLLWPIVAGYLFLNGLLWPALRPLIVRLARLRLVERVRLWLLTLPPYPALLLLAVPVAILEPLKLLAVYWSAEGHALSGLTALILLHGLSLLSTERLFAVLRPTLLQIGWFAALWNRIVPIRERLLGWVRSTPAWTGLVRMSGEIRATARRAADWLRANP